jgi:hypothetical protein
MVRRTEWRSTVELSALNNEALLVCTVCDIPVKTQHHELPPPLPPIIICHAFFVSGHTTHLSRASRKK